LDENHSYLGDFVMVFPNPDHPKYSQSNKKKEKEAISIVNKCFKLLS